MNTSKRLNVIIVAIRLLFISNLVLLLIQKHFRIIALSRVYQMHWQMQQVREGSNSSLLLQHEN